MVLEAIEISDRITPQHEAWLDAGTSAIKEQLPFDQPDITIVLGSGMGELVTAMGLLSPVTFTDRSVGLPVGKVEGHRLGWTAGFSPNGRKVLFKEGRTHIFEIPLLGIQTESWGLLSREHLATGYLRMLDRIGTRFLVTTHAAGGVAHPMLPGDEVPYESVPATDIIMGHIDQAYPNPLMGPYKGLGREVRFIGSREPDERLIVNYVEGLQKAGYKEPDRICYWTSGTTPSYEDPAYIRYAAILGAQAFGMSAGPDNRTIADMQNLEGYFQIATITNPAQVIPIGGNAELFQARARMNRALGLNITASAKDLDTDRRMQPIIPSAFELQGILPSRLRKAYPTTHEEVMRVGLEAIKMLKSGLLSIVENLPD